MKNDFEVRLLKKDPNPYIVKCLESLLERARKGEMRHIIYLVDLGDSFISNGVGDFRDRFNLIGQLEIMKMDCWQRREVNDQG